MRRGYDEVVLHNMITPAIIDAGGIICARGPDCNIDEDFDNYGEPRLGTWYFFIQSPFSRIL